MKTMKIIFIFLFISACSEDYYRKSMLEEVSSNPNVETINRWHYSYDWQNLIDLDISLKNGVRIYITDCKRDKNKNLVYDRFYDINGWWLWESIHYKDSDTYDCKSAISKAKEVLGNNSVIYLLDNCQELYDFYMNAPEFEPNKSNTFKEIFDKAPKKCMYDIYDENGRIIGVSKLYRRR